MKRVAIIIAGELRGIHNMENIMENIILPNDTYIFDIFIVTWDIQTVQENNIVLEKQTDYSLLEKYNPVQIQVNDIKLFDHQHHNVIYKKVISCHTYQFYACEQGIKLVETYESNLNIKYDLYLKYRFDLFLTKPLLFNEYDLTKIHGINFSSSCNSDAYWNDWLFFGDENIKDFMKIFSKICSGKLFRADCFIPEIFYEKSGNQKIVYDINHELVYLNKYGIKQFLQK